VWYCIVSYWVLSVGLVRQLTALIGQSVLNLTRFSFFYMANGQQCICIHKHSHANGRTNLRHTAYILSVWAFIKMRIHCCFLRTVATALQSVVIYCTSVPHIQKNNLNMLLCKNIQGVVIGEWCVERHLKGAYLNCTDIFPELLRKTAQNLRLKAVPANISQ
jgi:hypothetical protein